MLSHIGPARMCDGISQQANWRPVDERVHNKGSVCESQHGIYHIVMSWWLDMNR